MSFTDPDHPISAHAPVLWRLTESGEVHVWRASVSAWAAHVAALHLVLNQGELDRAEAFHRTRDRQQFVVAHGLLRRLLAMYTGGTAEAIQFDVGAAGKPQIRWAPHAVPIEFNMSHSNDVILIAVALKSPVGVDVERWSGDYDLGDLAGYAFSPGEVAEWLSVPLTHRTTAFFSGWTRKEAYIKGTGLGVSHGLDYFDVTLAPDRPAQLLTDRRMPDAASHWQLQDVPVPLGYSGALVVKKPVARILQLRCEPGDPAKGEMIGENAAACQPTALRGNIGPL